MNNDIIRMAREALVVPFFLKETNDEAMVRLRDFATLVAAAEREVLEAELLKLKRGVASTSEYIQGRWDLIGEFQDIIRARGKQ